jgi:hypothetical protein
MDEEFINPVRQSLGYYKNLFEEQKIKDWGFQIKFHLDLCFFSYIISVNGLEIIS